MRRHALADLFHACIFAALPCVALTILVRTDLQTALSALMLTGITMLGIHFRPSRLNRAKARPIDRFDLSPAARRLAPSSAAVPSARPDLHAAYDAAPLDGLLARLTLRLQGCNSLKDIGQEVQDMLPRFVPGLSGRLLVLDRSARSADNLCSWLDPLQAPRGISANACRAMLPGLPHEICNASGASCPDLKFPPFDRPNTLCLPLIAERQTLGLIYLDLPQEMDRMRPPPLRLAMLGQCVGAALLNLRIRETWRAMAMADALTGLANRRGLSEALAHLRQDTEKTRSSVSAAMIDIDHFKQFNDHFGHQAGDTVLRAVAEVVVECAPDASLAFRYGGEEFLLLLPGMTTLDAAACTECVRKRVAALHLRHEQRALSPVTCSIGLATTPEHCDFGKLLIAADVALYQAKERGRNRISIAIAETRGEADLVSAS